MTTKNADNLEKLYLIVDALNKQFPTGNDPFQNVSRLCEEAGELAKTVNHCQAMGIKIEKYGAFDKKAIAKEAQDVIRCVLQIVRFYGLEQEFEASIDKSLLKLYPQATLE